MTSGRLSQARRATVAFSLFELALVLAIIAVLGAIAVPRYGAAIARYRADAAARRVVADLDLARSEARQSSRSTTVTFDLKANQARIPGLADLRGPSYAYTTRFGDEPYQAQLVYADFGGDSQVIFDGWGLPDSDGQVIVRVGDLEKIVNLDQDTGKAALR